MGLGLRVVCNVAVWPQGGGMESYHSPVRPPVTWGQLGGPGRERGSGSGCVRYGAACVRYGAACVRDGLYGAFIWR